MAKWLSVQERIEIRRKKVLHILDRDDLLSVGGTIKDLNPHHHHNTQLREHILKNWNEMTTEIAIMRLRRSL